MSFGSDPEEEGLGARAEEYRDDIRHDAAERELVKEARDGDSPRPSALQRILARFRGGSDKPST
jgi:hypothetical protein